MVGVWGGGGGKVEVRLWVLRSSFMCFFQQTDGIE